MGTTTLKIEIINRPSCIIDTIKVCHLSDKNDYIQMTKWSNDEGYDIDIVSKFQSNQEIKVTCGMLEAILKVYAQMEYKTNIELFDDGD